MNSGQRMIREIKEKYKLNSPGVFFTMLKVPREEFIPQKYRNIAYGDWPVSIGFGQTISQPFTVAFMTDLLITPICSKTKVLEIGTGSGYQAAVLSFFFNKVYSIEIIHQLANRAKKTLKKLNYKNVYVKKGDGSEGWPQKSPFDAILITAAIKKVPQLLFNQLKDNGILVAPIGDSINCIMTRYIKRKNTINKKKFGLFGFVPFVVKKR